MTELQQAFHLWASAGCLTIAVFGVLLMLLGVVAPSSRRKAGGVMFSAGVVISLGACVLYLVYAVAVIVTVVVMRS